MMRDSSAGECVQRTYTAEQVAQILGISLRKAYGLCETTTQGRQEAKISWESENVPEMLAGNRGLMQAALPGQERRRN